VRVHGEGKLDATDQLSLAAREARRLRWRRPAAWRAPRWQPRDRHDAPQASVP